MTANVDVSFVGCKNSYLLYGISVELSERIENAANSPPGVDVQDLWCLHKEDR